MSMVKLAFLNFKASFKNYLSLIISLAFTILIFLNFQNIVYSEALETLGKMNARNIGIVVQAISVVLSCFMIFFIWYSTNVFLSKRKKDMGIYIFMGLTHQKIGQLYMIETTMIGLLSLILGIGFGLITSQLFQMILIKISEISIEIRFHFTLQPIIITMIVYGIIYFIFVLKGYLNIIKSSVLEMITAMRMNEYVPQKNGIFIIKTLLGIVILGYGYYLAIKSGGMEIMANVLLAVVFVVIGIYLLFGGLIPFIFQNLAKNKMFLYQKERNLWINNLIFRIRKNYRTYAIVCVLMLCSVTALATGFAMKNRYEGIVHFRNTYTYQVTSNQNHLDEKIQSLIEKNNDIEYHCALPILQIDASYIDTLYQNNTYMFLSYSDIQRIANETGLTFDLPVLKDDEIINLTQLHLLSFSNHSDISQTINGKTYQQIAQSSVPYLGRFQETFEFYIVSDQTYSQLQSIGTQMYCYNYKIKDPNHFQASIDDLNTIVSETDEQYTAYIAMDPHSQDIEWVKILYSVCIFMFMVFILASGSILYMKLYNDAFEDKNRYVVLRKIGIDEKTLTKSIAKELQFTYIAPLLVMAVSSFFSVLSLAKLMETQLYMVNLISVGVIVIFFMLCYGISVPVYLKNIEMK